MGYRPHNTRCLLGLGGQITDIGFKGRKKKKHARTFFGPGGVLLYGGGTLPELRSNTSRPHWLLAPQYVPFSRSGPTQGLWDSLEKNDFGLPPRSDVY
jgi:hypothetical protein